MADNYKQLALEHAQPGMILSDDLLDQHGKVLLPKGVMLTDATLVSLRRHGVAMVQIECAALSAADEATALARHSERIEILFRRRARVLT